MTEPRFALRLSLLLNALLTIFVVSASAPGTDLARFDQRLANLEHSVRIRPDGMTQVPMPFEVVDESGRAVFRVGSGGTSGLVNVARAADGAGVIELMSGRGSPLIQLGSQPGGFGSVVVSDGKGLPRAGMVGSGGVMIRNERGAEIASMYQSRGHGRFTVWEGEATVAQLMADSTNGTGTVWLREPGGKMLAAIGADPEGVAGGIAMVGDKNGKPRVGMSGLGGVSIKNEAGDDIANMYHTNGHGRFTVWEGENAVAQLAADEAKGGYLRITDGNGKVAAAILGQKRVIGLANSQEQTLASMTVSASGAGVFEAWTGGGKLPLAFMGGRTDYEGGVLQLSNGKATVTSVTVSRGGNGIWQLYDAGGQSMLEFGVTTEGVGMVRAGPMYKCGPSAGMVRRQPDCILGHTQ